MKIQTVPVFIVVLLIAPLLAAGQSRADKYVKNEVLIKFRAGADAAEKTGSVRSAGARQVEEFRGSEWRRVALPGGLSVEDAIRRFSKIGSVEAVQPNYYYHLQATPNDPQYSGLYAMSLISAPAAWDMSTGSAATVVAVIDTGIKYTHEDLAANMWTNPGEVNGNGLDDDGNGFIDDFYGYDFFFNDPDPQDEYGHGTHVAGTIGAVGNNGLGIAGVNWNVRLMSIKIYDSTGFGTTSAMLINAYNYVRMMRERGVNIRVTNNSYGGCDEACGYDQATKDAIDALGAVNILNVFAAGNNGRNIELSPFYPASYSSPSILTVANSTQTDARNTGSNWGPVSVDIAAPGSAILSTTRSSPNYGNMTGTSMASPHVAGAAALLSSYNPSLSAASLKSTIINTADPLVSWANVVRSGGRLNVAAALQNQTVCIAMPAVSSLSVPRKGGHFSIAVSAPPNCEYEVRSTLSWVHVTDPAPRMGSSTVEFRAALGPTIQRSGTVTIGGTTVEISQFGSGF